MNHSNLASLLVLGSLAGAALTIGPTERRGLDMHEADSSPRHGEMTPIQCRILSKPQRQNGGLTSRSRYLRVLNLECSEKASSTGGQGLLPSRFQ